MVKRYLETLFINESLECLQYAISQVTKTGTQLRPRDATIHPMIHLLSDTLGVEGYSQFPNQTSLFVCTGPSKFDLQDTIKTHDFAANTGKVRRREGPQKDLLDFEREHVVLIPTADNQIVAVQKSAHIVCEKPSKFFPVDVTSCTVSLASLARLTSDQIYNDLPKPASLTILYSYGRKILGVLMSDGTIICNSEDKDDKDEIAK